MAARFHSPGHHSGAMKPAVDEAPTKKDTRFFSVIYYTSCFENVSTYFFHAVD